MRHTVVHVMVQKRYLYSFFKCLLLLFACVCHLTKKIQNHVPKNYDNVLPLPELGRPCMVGSCVFRVTLIYLTI